MAGGGADALACIPPAALNKFVHHVIDGLCGASSAVPQHTSFKNCPPEKFDQARQEVESLARDLATDRLTQEEAGSLLSSLGPEAAGRVCEAVGARRQEIREAVAGEMLNRTRRLTDFDWNVRVAVSSSKVLSLNQPLLSLRLHSASQGKEMPDKMLEMTTAEVDSLLGTLREAQATLASLQK